MISKMTYASISKMLLAGAALSALSVGSAAAQSSDQIIVTATKRAQTLQEVPVAVSVVDSEVIEESQILDLIDLQSVVPSLRVTQQQNSSQTNFVIRGFGNGANNPGIESAVGVFIDGVFRSRSASSILDLPTLDRVEVLRGPQSTLFGKNVSVGAISITTRQPTFDWEGSVEATYGNLDTVQFRGTVSGPISDTLAFRVSGSTNNRDGIYTNLVTGDDNINERDRWAARAQLLWEPTDTMSWRLIGEYNRIDEVCCGAVQLVNGGATQLIAAPEAFGGLGAVITPVQDLDAREVALNTLPTNELVGRGGSLHGDWDIGWAQLTSITSWRQQIDNNNTDVDFSGADLAINPLRLDTKTFTQELRIAGETDTGFGRMNWLAGGFFFKDDVSFERDVIFQSEIRPFINGLLSQLDDPTSLDAIEAGIEGPSQLAQLLTTGATALFPEFMPTGGATTLGPNQAYQPGQGVFGDYELDNRSFSLFGQIDWEITDRLTITGGVSYINDRKIAVGESLLTDAFSNFDLTQFDTSGNAFVAATALGTAIGEAFNPADPTAFFTAAQTLAAMDPDTFAAARNGAVAFAQANPGLNPLLPLTAQLAPLGAVQFFNPQVDFPQPGAVREPGNTLSDDGFSRDTDFSYTARIAYDVTDNLNVYFNYGTGFKASAVSLTSDSTPPQQLPDGTVFGRFASPEEVRAFEVGLKTSFDGGFINIALFDQEVKNFQSNIFTGTGFIIANADVQSVRGFEVDAAYSPVEPLELTFALTYLDPEFESFPFAPCVTLGIGAETTPAGCINDDGEFDSSLFFDATGERPAGIHPVSLSTAAVYTHEFGNGAIARARVEYRFESEVQTTDNLPASVASREVNVINANLSYALENGFSINVWGRNLTDDDYLLTGFPTVVQTGSFSGYVNTPRTYGVTLRKTF